jgi:uncharacterized membrane protein YgdD (TMEM256/DUF423 family)
MNTNRWITVGALLMVLSIILGAMAAHSLAKILPENDLTSFKTGVAYLTYQSLGILVLALIAKTYQLNLTTALSTVFLGVCLFSFSIFILVILKHVGLTQLTKWVGPITPIGGVLMIVGWLLFIYTFSKKLKKDQF